jgi:hypothetical protein
MTDRSAARKTSAKISPKSSPKPARKPPAGSPPKPGKAAKAAKPSKPTQAAKPAKPPKAAAAAAAEAKAERVKLVRDSFTLPRSDVDLLVALKQRALKQRHEAKKSELVRAGLHALAALDDAGFLAALAAVPRLKTGRPERKKGR